MAEANHHQYVSHLALNYIVADVIATCLNRHLPSSHPIYKYVTQSETYNHIRKSYKSNYYYHLTLFPNFLFCH